MINDSIANYGDAICRLPLSATPAPTHIVCRPVAAFRIIATDCLADCVLTVLQDGETVLADVPRGFAWASTPIPGDYLVIEPDGSRSHRAAALFEAETQAVPARGAQMIPGQQLASRHDIRPSGSARVLNADGDVMLLSVPVEGLPLVPRYPIAGA